MPTAATDDDATLHERGAVLIEGDEPEALPPITFAVMKLVAINYAADIEDHQDRLVADGLRRRPAPDKLEEARVLRKIGELIDRVRADPQILKRLGCRPAVGSKGETGA